MGRKAEFKTNNEMELLARLAEKQPGAITASQLISVAYYLDTKAAAEAAAETDNRKAEGDKKQ